MNACVFERVCDVREERKGVCSWGDREMSSIMQYFIYFISCTMVKISV